MELNRGLVAAESVEGLVLWRVHWPLVHPHQLHPRKHGSQVANTQTYCRINIAIVHQKPPMTLVASDLAEVALLAFDVV